MFKPSQKQIASVIKMSEAQGIYPVENFDSFKQFQEHFEALMNGMKNLKKTARFKKAVKEGKVDMEKIREKKFDYYEDNEWVLESKAREYIDKYNPSIRKLEMYLSKKSRNPEQIAEIIENIGIDEERIIRSSIRERRDIMLQPYTKISQSLYNRLFDGPLINELISEHKQSEKSQSFREGVEQKVQAMCMKRTSFYKMKFFLGNLSMSGSEIEYMLEQFYDEDHQFDLAVAYVKTLLSHKDEKQIRKILEKEQYRYDEVNKIFQEANE